MSHDVDDVVELEDGFAKEHIEAGFAEAAKGGKSASKNGDGSAAVSDHNDINDIDEGKDHLSPENRGPIKGAEAQDHEGNVIETKLVDGKHVEVESTSTVATEVPVVATKAKTK